MYFTNLDNIPWVPGRIHLYFVGRRDQERILALTSGFVQWLFNAVSCWKRSLIILGGFAQKCQERHANIVNCVQKFNKHYKVALTKIAGANLVIILSFENLLLGDHFSIGLSVFDFLEL